jgi:glucose-1-phosphate thymidylyltransferase
MKGIILAGGLGTRLYPVTLTVCKQLLPVYDKPMVYYPLSVLMQAGIQEILIIATPEDLPRFEALFGDGSSLGLAISYAAQKEPKGIAQAFMIAEAFIREDSVALVLGDNIFYGHHLAELLRPCKDLEEGAIIFGYEVKNPNRYGVVEFDEKGGIKNILEKPFIAPSSYAVTGLYFYDNDVISIAKSLKPSARGELEITDVNKIYLDRKMLQLKIFDRGFAWLDAGTHEALQQAASYVQTIQERQGVKIACIEEIALQQGFIGIKEFLELTKKCATSEYGKYLLDIAERKSRAIQLAKFG